MVSPVLVKEQNGRRPICSMGSFDDVGDANGLVVVLHGKIPNGQDLLCYNGDDFTTWMSTYLFMSIHRCILFYVNFTTHSCFLLSCHLSDHVLKYSWLVYQIDHSRQIPQAQHFSLETELLLIIVFTKLLMLILLLSLFLSSYL